MKRMRNKREHGSISGSLVAIILLVLGMVMLGVLSVWLYIQYSDQKSNVDAKVALAVSEAEKEQADDLETKFLEREKEPNYEFAGPGDYGRLTLRYPKTWSVYVANAATEGGDFEAYFHPKIVPSTEGDTQRFALRVKISDTKYEDATSEFNSLVEEGALRSTGVTLNGVSGLRFDGKFSDEIRGAVVVFKIRDKTVTLSSDSDTFKPDFNKIVKSVKFNV